MSSDSKFGPNQLSLFDVCWMQTDRQANYVYIDLSGEMEIKEGDNVVGIFLYASEILSFVEDWRTRLTTADGSSLELDPDLLEDAQDEVDLKRTRLVTRIQLSSIFFCQYYDFYLHQHDFIMFALFQFQHF